MYWGNIIAMNEMMDRYKMITLNKTTYMDYDGSIITLHEKEM